ncbi:MAG: SRPBCC family protein [Thermoanaerobaculia bacterium]|nr:SRPBCC family protein [Thermoanaerobaculia bacterium]
MESRSRSLRTYEARLDLPLEEVFAWTSDVERLDELTPPWFVLEPVAPPPPRLFVGVEIEYRFRWRRFGMRWRSRITDWRPPHDFVYEQACGPFREFRHEHLFRPVDGGTLMEDRVIYRTWGGRWVDRWLVGPDLDRVFAHRARALGVAAGVARGPEVLEADEESAWGAGERAGIEEVRGAAQVEAPPAKRMP